MKYFKYLAFITLLFFAVFFAVQFIEPKISQENLPQLFTVSENNFKIEIKTIGPLDAARSHMVSSEIRGDKGKIIYLVNDGQHVKQGDVLVKLDPTPFEEEVLRLKAELLTFQSGVEASEQILEWEKNQVEREIKTAEFNLQIAKFELKQLIEGDGPLQISQLKEEMEKANEEYNRYAAYISDLKKLNDKGYENLTEIKLAEKKAIELKAKYNNSNKKYTSYTDHVFPSLKEASKARVEKAEMELEQTEKGGVFKIAKAIAGQKETRSKLDIVTDSLQQAESELAMTTITAPFAGIAILYETFRDSQKRKPRVGDSVLKNQPLLYLPDISSMVIQTGIREIDLHKIALGQKCAVRVDAYPETLLDGEVTFVGVMASNEYENRIGEKYFQLTVSLKTEDLRLRPGMTARVSILVDDVKDVLSLPVQAIFEESGKFYCYKFLQLENSFKKVEVKFGRQNEDLAEIISGLQKGEQVSLIQPMIREVE